MAYHHELINNLKEKSNEAMHYATLLQDAAETIEELLNPQWIEITEDKRTWPEENKTVLVLDHNGKAHERKLVKGEGIWSNGRGCKWGFNKYTHWMDKPAVPANTPKHIDE